MNKDRLLQVSQELFTYLQGMIGDNEEFQNVLERSIGLSTNEIDELSGNFPEENFNEDEITDFYIGTDNGSGMEFNSKEDFLHEVSLMIDDCAANGGTRFDITVDADADCFYHPKSTTEQKALDYDSNYSDKFEN